MKPYLLAALILALTASGCATADNSLGHTTAKMTLPGGATIDWDNTKNIDVGFVADPANDKFTFSLKSATPEAAMANVAASNAETAAALRDLAAMLKDLIPAAAKAGAMSGS